MNNKGLMKVQLLAILLIIGIIFFTGIPWVTNYITNKKKDNYITVAKAYIEEVKGSINGLEYKQVPLENEALLVKISNIKLNKRSQYGTFNKDYSYVIVVNNGSYYDYYFASIDSSMHGIPVVNEKELNRESIVYGEDKLSGINHVDNIENLYLANTVFTKSTRSLENDKNILLSPLKGELTVSYDFKKEVHKIYDNIIKNIDTDIYNKEVNVNNGVVKYNNKSIYEGDMSSINGTFRYLSFPNEDSYKYYAGFVTYTNSYVAGIINNSDNYSSKNMVFDSMPAIAINKNASLVIDKGKKYLMWNLMALYPNNNNYTVTECGALIIKNNTSNEVKLDFDTNNVLIGKSNNNCELGNIFAIRKDNLKKDDRYFARGYIKYKDRDGVEYISYSSDTVSYIVS